MRRRAMGLAMLAAASLSGCDQTTGPAETRARTENPSLAIEDNERIPVDGIAHSDCGGEDIAVTGTYHPVTAVTSDGRGGFHLMVHYNIEAKGTSETTGAQYVVHQRVNFTLNSPATTLGNEQTRTDMFSLIGQGSAPNEVMTGVVHITVDANGRVTSLVDQLRLKC